MQVFNRFSLILLLSALLASCQSQAGVASPKPPLPSATLAPTPLPSATPLPPTATPAPTATAAPTAVPTAIAMPTALPTTTPPADDLATYAAAMRDGFAGDIAAHASIPRYTLRMSVDPAAGRMTGSEQIRYLNRTGAPLADLALRLYPNFPRDALGKGGDTQMTITGAAVDGLPVTTSAAARGTALLLALDPPLPAEQIATVTISWTATLKPWGDGTWPLPSYYPMLAVHEPAGWRLDVTNFPDRVYAESALYQATIDIPANLTLAASGSTLARTEQAGRAIYQVATGPVREFALTVGDFAVAQASADGVAVHVYTARGSQLDARSIARVSAAALRDFDRRFGRYPYRELDLHLLHGQYDGGDEYPGLILLYSGGPVSALTRYVAAHEVAHQWWYGVIGNDIYQQPWLDEAFAQYSGIIYDEDVAGAAIAAADWQREVARRYRSAQADGDLPVGRSIAAYRDFNVYYRTVYGKGAWFLRELRGELGDAAFFAGLQRYYTKHRYGIARSADVQRAFEASSGRDLSALFRAWIGP